MMDYFKITFGEIRKFCSALDRISACMLESQGWENFESIRDMPHRYDALYLYGFGNAKSEFSTEGRLSLWSCLEFVLSKNLWEV